MNRQALRGNSAAEFAHEGFIAEVRAAQPALDIVAVDAHPGYYLTESIVDRVWTDVIAPAHAQGYQRIWLAGISMGGLGAVAIARQRPEAIDRVILLAPASDAPDEQQPRLHARLGRRDKFGSLGRLAAFVAAWHPSGPEQGFPTAEGPPWFEGPTDATHRRKP